MERISYAKLIHEMKETGMIRSVTILNGKRAGEKYLLSAEEAASLTNTPEASGLVLMDGDEVYYEVLYDLPRFVLCGAGHVGVCLADLAHQLGYHVTVIDDRSDFLTEERFPTADRRILCESFTDAFWETIPESENTFYVLATKSHETDTDCALQILQRKSAYVGMLGSRNKAEHVRNVLREHEFSEEKIAHLTSPMGLPLGGRRPIEVALSVLAQMTQIRYQHNWTMLDPDVVEALAEDVTEQDFFVATIIKVAGHTPRGIGTKMLTNGDVLLGTIGGGIVEYAAFKEGNTLLGGQKTVIKPYGLAEDRDGIKGMQGGGRITVLFERL